MVVARAMSQEPPDAFVDEAHRARSNAVASVAVITFRRVCHMLPASRLSRAAPKMPVSETTTMTAEIPLSPANRLRHSFTLCRFTYASWSIADFASELCTAVDRDFRGCPQRDFDPHTPEHLDQNAEIVSGSLRTRDVAGIVEHG
jgi:hypothetical protein